MAITSTANQMASDSRADLKTLSDMNVERFDATLKQRAAELDAKIDRRAAELDAKIDRRAADLDAKIDTRAAETRADLHQTIGGLRSSLEARFSSFETTMHNEITSVRKDMLAHTRFQYLAWAVQVAAIVGLYAR